MLLEIKTYPDEILGKKAKPVDAVGEEERELIRDMIETMREEGGVGLAAPQVGVSKRVIIVDIGEGPVVLVNPEIMEKEGGEFMEEGCLSVPGEYIKVKRATKIKAKGLDAEGKKTVLDAEGLLARVIQHEVDHLEGVLILDKMNPFDKIKEKFFKK